MKQYIANDHKALTSQRDVTYSKECQCEATLRKIVPDKKRGYEMGSRRHGETFEVKVRPTVNLAAWLLLMPTPASAQTAGDNFPIAGLWIGLGLVILSVGSLTWWLWTKLRERAQAHDLSTFGIHLWIAVFGLVSLWIGSSYRALGAENLQLGLGVFVLALIVAGAVVYYKTRDWILALAFPAAALLFALGSAVIYVVSKGVKKNLGEIAEHDRVTRNERARQWVRRMN